MPKHFTHFFLHPWQLCRSTITTSCFSPLLLRISTCPATFTLPPSLPCLQSLLQASSPHPVSAHRWHPPSHSSPAFYWTQAPLLGFLSHCHSASCPLYFRPNQRPTLRFSSLNLAYLPGAAPICSMLFSRLCLHPFVYAFTEVWLPQEQWPWCPYSFLYAGVFVVIY